MGAIIGGAIGAAGSIGGSAISASALKKMQKRQHEHEFRMLTSQQLQQEARSKQAQAEGALGQEQRARTEEARLGLFGALGAPGTYGEGLGTGGFESVGPLYTDKTIEGTYTAKDLFGKGNVPEKLKEVAKQGFDYSASAKLLNVENFLNSAKSEKSFQIVSQLVGESADLLNRSGPAWDRLEQATIGSINEGAATMQREMMDQVSRDLARGGTARRQGLATAQKMQAIETANRMRTAQTWQAKLGIEDYVRKNAMNTQIFAQAWVANHEGIRDEVTNAMSNLTTMWTQNALAPLLGASANAYATYSKNMGALNAQEANQFSSVLGNAVSGFGQLAGGLVTSGELSGLGQSIMGFFKNTFGEGLSSPVGSAADIASGGGVYTP